MVYGIYQSAAGLQVNQYRQAVLANNLANASTVGFKHDFPVVRERKVETAEDLVNPSWSDRSLDRLTGGSLVAPTYTSFAQGQLEKTDGNLDVALDGEGFFMVSDGGKTRYTRDGRIAVNNEGLLVSGPSGCPVLDAQGQTISVPRGAKGQVRIDGNGVLRAGDADCGRIGVVDFDDRSRLIKTGSGLFEAVGTQPKAAAASLRVGAVECSTVDPTQTMVTMIQVARAYEMNASVLKMADTTLGRAVNDIARIR